MKNNIGAARGKCLVLDVNYVSCATVVGRLLLFSGDFNESMHTRQDSWFGTSRHRLCETRVRGVWLFTVKLSDFRSQLYQGAMRQLVWPAGIDHRDVRGHNLMTMSLLHCHCLSRLMTQT